MFRWWKMKNKQINMYIKPPHDPSRAFNYLILLRLRVNKQSYECFIVLGDDIWEDLNLEDTDVCWLNIILMEVVLKVSSAGSWESIPRTDIITLLGDMTLEQ